MDKILTKKKRRTEDDFRREIAAKRAAAIATAMPGDIGPMLPAESAQPIDQRRPTMTAARYIGPQAASPVQPGNAGGAASFPPAANQLKIGEQK